MLKIIKYAVFVLYVQSSLACAKGDASGKYVEAFLFSGEKYNLVVSKPLDPVAVKSLTPLGKAIVFGEAKVGGVDFWVGHYLPNNNADPVGGLFYGDKKHQINLVDGDRGFFKKYGELYFAFVVEDSDQHRDFSAVYLVGVDSNGGAWAQRIYVLTGSIVDAVEVDGSLLISGMEMGEPFAANVDIKAHPPIVRRLELSD